MQEACLAEFGQALKGAAPGLFQKKCLGAAVYWLLSGHREAARRYIAILSSINWKSASALRLLAALPTPVLRVSFAAYRTFGD